MKRLSILGFLIASFAASAQFEHGTALVPGSITIRKEETQEEYCNNVLRLKTITSEQYSTSLNGVVYWTNEDLKMIHMFPPKNGLQGTMMTFNNFTQTLPEGATGWDGKNYNIPVTLSAAFTRRSDSAKIPVYGLLNATPTSKPFSITKKTAQVRCRITGIPEPISGLLL